MAREQKKTDGTNGNRANANKASAARGGADEAGRLLRDFGAQALSIEEAAERLAAASNEQAATGEQIRTSLEALAAGIEESAAAAQTLARSQVHAAETAR